MNSRRTITLLAASLVVLLSQSAGAGRGTPDPVFKQFADGYGVVAAEVIEADQPPFESDGTLYGATCRVVSVPADAVRTKPRLGLKPGDVFSMVLRVGYGGAVERWGGTDDGAGNPLTREGEGPLDAGARFYFTIRPTSFGTFEHADGADAARRVAEFDPKIDAFYAKLHEIAALPFGRHWEATLTTAGDPQADADVRYAALEYLRRYFFANGELAPEYVAIAKDRLWKLWRTPEGAFAEDRLYRALDGALANFDWAGFADSQERRASWMARIFAPLPAGAQHDEKAVARRCELAYMLETLAERAPAEVGARVVAEVARAEWPDRFRVALTKVLLWLYLDADAVEPAWEPALQGAFAQWAATASDPNDVRVLAGTVGYAATAGIRAALQGPRRHFFIRPATQELLAQRASQLRSHPGPGDPDWSTLAANELDEALKTVRSAADRERR